MKTLPLRELLRQPARVKKLTAAGHEIHITDRGKPLWVIHSAQGAATCQPAQDHVDEAFWQELLATPTSSAPSFHKVLMDSRR